MKKIISVLTIAAMTVSLAGCSIIVTKQPTAGETYTGTVDSIDEEYIFILTEDNESYRIELSEDTVYSYEGGGMGGGTENGGDIPSGGDMNGGGTGGGQPSGDMPSGGGDMPESAGQARDGDSGSTDTDGGSSDESGEASDDASADTTSAEALKVETTAAENGSSPDASSGNTGGEAPSGDVPDNNGGEAPSGDMPDNSGGAPSGDMPDNAGGAPSGDMPDNGSGSDASSGDENADSDDSTQDSGEVSDEDMLDDDQMAVDDEATAAANAQDTGLTYEDVSEGDTVTVVVNDEKVAESITISGSADSSDSDAGDADGGSGAAGGNGGGDMGGGSSSGSVSYSALNEYTEDTTVSGETIESTGTDENAVLLSTADVTVTLDDVTILRDSDDSTGGDNSSFYGVGASSLVTSGTLKVLNSTITSDAAGGAGVFAYGDGVAYVSDTTITTKQDTSGGIHVAGGGTLYAWNLDVTTAGGSSAAIRSDRGSGTMVVDGGTYTSNGTGSPAIYSAADVTVHDATLTATASEAICIEGLNSIRLFDCDLTGTMADDSQNDCTWNIILYQSMSGDSEVGNSTFEMVGGTLTAENGGMFYTTNTESTFIISDVDITYAEDSEFLFKCTGNSNQRGWGSSGSNGADSTFTAIDQVLEGDVIWDTISQMDFYLTDASTLTGAVLNDESQTGGTTGSGYASVYIDETSTWVVTGDSTLTNLYNAGTITDEDGNTVSVVGTDGTEYVSGTSGYTITVDTYEETADLSGASTLDSWSDFEVSQE